MNIRLSILILSVAVASPLCQARPAFSAAQPYDLYQITDPGSLDTEVLVDWRDLPRDASLKQKLIEITVCDWWPGQAVRVPVTFVVPKQATPCENILLINMGLQRKPATPTNAAYRLAKEKGVGVVMVGMGVIEGMQPAGQLHKGMLEKMLETKNIRYTPAWLWGISQMRGLTAALAEEDAFRLGKVIASGGSKRGIGSAIAGIHDPRFTGIVPVVAPPMGNPGEPFVVGTENQKIVAANKRFYRELEAGKLGLNAENAAALKDRSQRRKLTRITLDQARAAGWSSEDIERANGAVWDIARIVNYLDEVQEKGLDYLYVVGTNDSVTPALLELGRKHPKFPLSIVPGGQHGGPGGAGYTRRVPILDETHEKLESFARYHFFSERTRVDTPIVKREWDADARRLTITARFPKGQEPDTNELWWSVNKSRPYTLYFEYDSWESAPMKRIQSGLFEVTVTVPENANRVDFLSTHKHMENDIPWYVSSPYLRFTP